MTRLSPIVLLVCSGCGTLGLDGSHVPELGDYGFVASFAPPGGGTTAAHGALRVFSANDAGLSYRFTLQEANGATVANGTARWSGALDYPVASPAINRAGIWILTAHLRRSGSVYECYGDATRSDLSTAQLHCTWRFPASDTATTVSRP